MYMNYRIEDAVAKRAKWWKATTWSPSSSDNATRAMLQVTVFR